MNGIGAVLGLSNLQWAAVVTAIALLVTMGGIGNATLDALAEARAKSDTDTEINVKLLSVLLSFVAVLAGLFGYLLGRLGSG